MLAELFHLVYVALALAGQGPAPPIAFRPLAREVTNWRNEAFSHLELPMLAGLGLNWGLETHPALGAASALAGENRLNIARCVKLNNYWCIKRAGWAGEIAADAEGHVAFASAGEGALVAASLLRRYYIDFNRHSAMDIVSRWAPAQCGLAGAGGGRGLATRGLGNTLRARFLAQRRRRGGRAIGLRRSVVKERAVALIRAPTIAVGLGESAAPVALASLGGALAALPFREPAFSGATCASESVRIQNYARAASQGAAADERADLKLFDADGAASANLARVMQNMAAVEIGPLRPREDLVLQAVAALPRREPPPPEINRNRQ